MTTRLRQFKLGLWLTAFVVATQLLFANAMAADNGLHKHCHDHADDPDHQCLVTLMLGGGYDSELPDIQPVNVVPETPPTEMAQPVCFIAMPTQLVGGIMAHAPPRGP